METTFSGKNPKHIIINISKKSLRIIVLLIILLIAGSFIGGYITGRNSVPENNEIKKEINKVKYILPEEENFVKIDREVKTDKKKDKIKNVKEPAKKTKKKLPEKIVVPKTGSSDRRIKFRYYTINVCSLKDKKIADNKADILKNRNYDARVEKVKYELTGVWYKVLIGKYKTKEEAFLKGSDLEKWGIIPSFWVEGIK